MCATIAAIRRGCDAPPPEHPCGPNGEPPVPQQHLVQPTILPEDLMVAMALHPCAPRPRPLRPLPASRLQAVRRVWERSGKWGVCVVPLRWCARRAGRACPRAASSMVGRQPGPDEALRALAGRELLGQERSLHCERLMLIQRQDE
jgi:hypothetical protein